MEKQDLNILIGGAAGQGLVTVGNLLSKILVRSGYYIVVNQSYQSRIRGGHNTFAIRISNQELKAHREPVDLLVALDMDTVTLHEQELSPDSLVLVDTACPIGNFKCLPIPFKELGEMKFTNVVALGVICSLLGQEQELVSQTVDDLFGKKGPAIMEKNRQVLSDSYNWCSQQSLDFPKLNPVAYPGQRLLMNGNDAIAMGALSAGVKFCSFYPMTPSTSIALNLAAHAKEMGLVVEQAEDEIAAINMAIGASFAGAPSIVTTSGGGFALMCEGVSLAAMTETPVVIVVAQRPGPATGLPTRTEQADLEFVLHSGHGEFPRAIYSPGTIEECFSVTRTAFEVAALYQGPMFILTDQYLADSLRAVDPFDIENLQPVNPGIEKTTQPVSYQRFAITQNGVSPRMLPGMSNHLVVADSDEHTEDGHITEDLSVRKQMMEKRLKKEQGIISYVIPPEIIGDKDPELLLVTWGSSKGAVLEAAEHIRAKGIHIATMHFPQVWPIVPGQFINHLENAKQVVCIEGNACGQMARLIRRETGFLIQKKVLRYDGLPITPEYIFNDLMN